MTPMWMPSLVTALDVIGIAVQRDQEPVPRALGVDGGKYPAWVTKLNVEPWEVRRS